MLSHEGIWKAIDGLAYRLNLSPSALARRSGLDPTSFNPSKRVKADGRPRWPSTESIAKILDATDTDLNDFLAPIMTRERRSVETGSWSTRAIVAQKIPKQWPRFDKAVFSPEARTAGLKNSSLFVLEIAGDFLFPLYRDGDILLLANTQSYQPGDRVILQAQSSDLVAGEVIKVRKRSLSLITHPERESVQTFTLSNVEWVARIVWVSQ
ncbi:Phage repressor protein C, contains Cro/C1-type HTH and peptisase s24 domains [Cohaesibacter sp. ES.047]|uniref:S24 family peptidase n=1 Tax=Cohaesibacter sp. ES.047 TaxID=1798205 RepID=UPI000BB8A42B|nr:Phage repressor protein C, contains Cro/C1-type HTH and peptisase s24 domains [Cohaesibacter sp. ES.047]